MKDALIRTLALRACVVLLALGAGKSAGADDQPVSRGEFLQLQQQNQQLLDQMRQQQQVIDALTHKVSDLETVRAATNPDAATANASVASEPESSPTQGFHLGKINLSGEGGVAFFESGSDGQTPNSEFRVDEARLFLDAPVWNDVYFYTELDLATHEGNDLSLRYAELYLDFEDVSQLWGRDRMLNIRAGRFYIPFGEEYQNRFAIDNPLISHSLSDLWGEDNGVELYGSLGRVSYAVAVQNGGSSASRDYTGDKSVTGRIGYDPANWLHLSVSGMRTGDLSAQQDVVSAMWFGGGFFRSVGSSNTTLFHANLVEGDAQVRLDQFQFKTAGGYINYGDNDPNASNRRDVYYFYTEGTHDFTRKLYGAARFSEVFAHNGFPIVGNGDMGQYLFEELTSQYWRLSLGLGYRFSPNLIVKGEYSFNRGRELDGSTRDHQDLFALEAAFQF